MYFYLSSNCNAIVVNTHNYRRIWFKMQLKKKHSPVTECRKLRKIKTEKKGWWWIASRFIIARVSYGIFRLRMRYLMTNWLLMTTCTFEYKAKSCKKYLDLNNNFWKQIQISRWICERKHVVFSIRYEKKFRSLSDRFTFDRRRRWIKSFSDTLTLLTHQRPQHTAPADRAAVSGSIVQWSPAWMNLSVVGDPSQVVFGGEIKATAKT